MPIEPGSRLLHYRVVEKIGEGGMGEVWKAEDTNLQRTVAIKFLPRQLTYEPSLLTRFEREARLLASLNHPHVSAIHGLERDGDQRFLVLEHIEGEGLDERLRRGPLPVEQALKHSVQIAKGLAAAHGRGVLHRDLKPGNIKFTREGQVKVLDFGLAKTVRDRSAEGDPTELETTFVTAQNVIVGTAPYMSPEQAAGSPNLDRRTDIWAFGCVLYEMLCGRQAFAGKTISATFTAIHGSDPDWSVLPANTPPRIRALLRRCLEKDPDRRLHDVGDARLEIEDALAGREWEVEEGTPLEISPRRPWVMAIGGVVVVLAGIVAGILLHGVLWPSDGTAVAVPTVRFSVDTPGLGGPFLPRFSPDGRTIVYGAFDPSIEDEDSQTGLYLYSLEEGTSRRLPGTEGVWLDHFDFSPDGQWLALAMRAGESPVRTFLYKVEIEGDGERILLAEFEERLNSWLGGGLAWLAEDVLVALLGSLRHGDSERSLLRVASDGVTPATPVPLDQVGLDHGLSAISRLPDGRHVLGLTSRGCLGCLAVVDTTTGSTRVFEGLRQLREAVWSPTGHLFLRPEDDRESLRVVPFDLGSLEPVGGVTALPTERGVREFDLSPAGHLVWRRPSREMIRTMKYVNRDGSTEEFLPEQDMRTNVPVVSGDGTLLAVNGARGYGDIYHDIWISDVAQPALRKLTSMPGLDCDNQALSHTGRYLAVPCVDWFGERDDEGIYLFPTDNSGPGELILPGNAGCTLTAGFTPDDRWLIVTECDQDHRSLLAVRPGGDGKRARIPLALGKETGSARLSTDGRWLAYSRSSASDTRYLYVRRFGENGELGDEMRVGRSGWGRWMKNPAGEDQVLAYRTPDGKTMEVAMVDDPAGISSPRLRLETLPEGMGQFTSVSGDRWLAFFDRPADPEAAERGPGFEVMLNWTEQLRRELAEAP